MLDIDVSTPPLCPEGHSHGEHGGLPVCGIFMTKKDKHQGNLPVLGDDNDN